MIEVQEIHKSYGENKVLHGLNFSVPSKGITGLVGPNGSGKSTVIRIITGFSDADFGAVKINNEIMSVDAVAVKRLVGYAPESAPSYREQTVREYLVFIAQLRGVQKYLLEAEVRRVAEAFSLNMVLRQSIGTLSKGYRHRLSLAQCLLGDPPVIVLDEPTDGLDPLQKSEARKVIVNLAKNKTVLLTTHLLEEIKCLCDRVVAINKGKVIFEGGVRDLYSDSTLETIVFIRVEKRSDNELALAIGSIEGFISFQVNEFGDFLEITISVNVENKDQDVLNDISLSFAHYGFRIVELKRKDSLAKNILSYWGG